MRQIFLLGLLFLLATATAFAQTAGTITGRVIDQSGAIIPGATVTVTNTGTGLGRTTATNEAGLYSFAALQPGTYNVQAELAGFVTSAKNGVMLIAASTIAVDFQLGVATVSQQVEVSEAGLAVETTQSVVAGSIQTSEIQELPMLNRTFMGLVTLLPEARPAPTVNSTRITFGGGISVGGAQGRNIVTLVDGAENRDDIAGGPMMNFSIEGIQEFKLLAHSFSAAYGRGNNSILQVVTKSGTNQLHGTVFAFGRNDAMTATEYFNKAGNLPKSPYDREQVGGSLGGPIKKDRWFIFGAAERTNQNYTLTLPTAVFNEAVILQKALPNLVMTASQFIPQPSHDFLLSVKSDHRINDHHSLYLRWAQQNQYAYDDQFTGQGLISIPQPDVDPRYSYEENRSFLWSGVASENWIIGNNSVNTFTVQRSYYDTNITMPTTVPSAQWPLQNLNFPSLRVGRGPGTDQEFFQKRWEIKDDFAHQASKHSLKFGGGVDWYPEIGLGILLAQTMGRMGFYDNPSTIVNNTNGKYPLGFATPGIVSDIGQGVGTACGCTWKRGGPGDARLFGMKDIAGYFQDDWNITPRLTLNLGLRYDLPINSLNQRINANNRGWQVLRAIAHLAPTAAHWTQHTPRTPTNNVSPRFGLAWDVKGDGKTVIRLGGGLYWDKHLFLSQFQSALIAAPIIDVPQITVNTSIGVGQLANYVYNVSPLPPPLPPAPTTIPFNANLAPTLMPYNLKNPSNTQEHVGFTRVITPNTTISSDYTHILGTNETRRGLINPIEGAWDPTDADQHIPWGQRRFAPAFNEVFPGQPNILGNVFLYGTGNLSKYDELATQIVHHGKNVTLQASYTLASARAFGGIVAGALGGTQAPLAAGNPDEPDAPIEWGPAFMDERHRMVLSTVVNLPKGFQVSPVIQAVSARPYTPTQGQDLNGDGSNTDLWINPDLPGDPSAVCGCPIHKGQVMGVGSLRGKPIVNLDARVTKSITFSDRMKLGLFVEFYNITNRANFGNHYNSNSRATTFRQPYAFVTGFPQSRQLQLGARFTF